MSASTDGRHYDLDLLADLAEDLLPDDEATAARAHLASCGSCRADLDAVQGMAPLLRSVAPASMPPEVVLRVEAALARESASRTSVGVAATSLDDAHRRAHPRPDRRPSRIRRTATALVGVAAVLGGALFVGQTTGWLGGGGADSPTAGGARDTIEADAGSDGAGEESGETATQPGPEADLDAFAAREYTSTGLADEVRSLLAAATPPRVPDTVESPADTTAETDGVPDRTAAGSCLKAVAAAAGNDGAPLGVDVSTFDGRDAVVVVLPPSDERSDLAEIWVVGTGCVDATDSRLEVLDRQPFAVDSPAG